MAASERKKDKNRNFVPAKTGFLAIFVMVLSTVVYGIIYGLPGLTDTKVDTGFCEFVQNHQIPNFFLFRNKGLHFGSV